MSTATPTTPTVLSPAPIPAQVLATGSLSSRYTLDLRTKWGAWLFVRVGRRVATALTASARVIARPTFNNDASINPNSGYDRVSSTAAVTQTTVGASTTIGATTMTLASGTGFAAGDLVCISAASASGADTSVEFARVSSVSGAVLTFDAPLKVAHTLGDVVCNGSDVFNRTFLQGGATYEIRADNGASGQSLVFEVLGSTYDSDTIA